MNISELAELAEQAAYNIKDEFGNWIGREFDKEKFAELVAEHEREECAKLCDNWECDEDFVDNIADAIRARGKA